jgi:hypothetical protein
LNFRIFPVSNTACFILFTEKSLLRASLRFSAGRFEEAGHILLRASKGNHEKVDIAATPKATARAGYRPGSPASQLEKLLASPLLTDRADVSEGNEEEINAHDLLCDAMVRIQLLLAFDVRNKENYLDNSIPFQISLWLLASL